QLVEPRQDFEYDALYQLVAAEGREAVGQNLAVDDHDDPRRFLAFRVDGNAVQRYRQRYAYDLSGNLATMRHLAGNGAFTNQWTRTFTRKAQSNRLQTVSLGGQPDTFHDDASGNLTALPHLPGIFWDFQGRMTRLDLGGGGTAWYQYDAEGQRVRKVVARQGGAIAHRAALSTPQPHPHTPTRPP